MDIFFIPSQIWSSSELGNSSKQSMSGLSPPIPTRVLAVIVLYKTIPANSNAFRTLRAVFGLLPPNSLDLKVLLYDNTPGGCDPGAMPDGVLYEAAQQNAGLAAAYNRALKIAEAEGFAWLLTLDQDTSLPENFLLRLSEIAVQVSLDTSIAAIVPQISDSGRILSPYWFGLGSIPRYFSAGFTGIPKRASYAFNSASTLRVSDLRMIGAYNPRFWLDSSDHYLYRRLYRYKKRIYVAGDIQVEHHFSVLDMNHSVSTARYENILNAGCAFWDLELGWLAGLDYTARLAYRTFYKHWKHGHYPAFRRASLKMLKKRLFWSKKRRIERWKRETECRLLSLSPGKNSENSSVRPQISVCMATYNGERYIAAQLRSILNQLADSDEVIVVDDASCDQTVAIIERFCDRRIRIIHNPRNCGVVASFEKSLLGSSGNIIFLSDQDDIWKPDKVSRVMRAFNDPTATLVLSDAKIIDAEGKDIEQSYFQTRGGFVSGVAQNILHNHYIGCTIAFRRQILAYCLPFPKKLPMHDSWIGIVNDSLGKTVYIDEPLVNYRRHGKNVSQSGSLAQRVRWRISLFNNIVGLRMRVAYRNIFNR